MNKYKLLTPGPLTTSDTVKQEMLFDRCTWDDDYKCITQKIRKQLLEIARVSEENYTAVLMQGNGTFAVEAAVTTAIGINDKCLVITNGAYGERIACIAKYAGLNHVVYATEYNKQPDIKQLAQILQQDTDITHIVMVHCETTTGILNPLEPVCQLAKDMGKTLVIDAMSSFGGIEIEVERLGIDFLISSANKCIQGVPGFGFVIANTGKLLKCGSNSRSLSLDLYDQWKEMNKDGKWRYTSPTHVVAAFSRAIDELLMEGGVAARYARYSNNNLVLRSLMTDMGFKVYLDESLQSPIITSFLYPEGDFSFPKFYQFIKDNGFVIYPGKLTDFDTFRIGNIGEIYESDIRKLCDVISRYMKEVAPVC